MFTENLVIQYTDGTSFKSVFEDEEFVSNEEIIATTVQEIKARNGKDVSRVLIVEKQHEL